MNEIKVFYLLILLFTYGRLIAHSVRFLSWKMTKIREKKITAQNVSNKRILIEECNRENYFLKIDQIQLEVNL
jgi:hypothetical protein